jgi:hypothetical protein
MIKRGRHIEAKEEDRWRHHILRAEQNFFFNFPRHCINVLLVEVQLREGKSLGSEEVIGLESGLCYKQRIELRKSCLRSEFFIYCGKPALG